MKKEKNTPAVQPSDRMDEWPGRVKLGAISLDKIYYFSLLPNTADTKGAIKSSLALLYDDSVYSKYAFGRC
ncbi:hypothetical protein TNIN_438331 [Trichonephila inaurata madagascariensis]|uniref:Uncharacterized protein n=1 Tax=Trichonephila inaurata madagascariensis TaxID=2747483 RepID=A0A8X6XQQ0_9ARAC|nr:hypothetical protein TNIN_438331 [Trichonephila inaurata madagascariensis]